MVTRKAMFDLIAGDKFYGIHWSWVGLLVLNCTVHRVVLRKDGKKVIFFKYSAMPTNSTTLVNEDYITVENNTLKIAFNDTHKDMCLYSNFDLFMGHLNKTINDTIPKSLLRGIEAYNELKFEFYGTNNLS